MTKRGSKWYEQKLMTASTCGPTWIVIKNLANKVTIRCEDGTQYSIARDELEENFVSEQQVNWDQRPITEKPDTMCQSD